LINFWDKVSVENGEIDASNDFGLLTLDAIGISGFGQEFKAVENQDKTFSDIIDVDKRREELEKSDKEGYAFDKTDLLSKMMNSHIPDEIHWNKKNCTLMYTHSLLRDMKPLQIL
jgi:hypothetical protein